MVQEEEEEEGQSEDEEGRDKATADIGGDDGKGKAS